MRFYLFLIFTFFVGRGFCDLSYKVEYIGVENTAALKTIKATTHLSTLKKTAPESISALRYRAESDTPDIIKILHAHGYYEASVQIKIEETLPEAVVLVYVRSGPAYTVSSFTFSLFECTKDHCVACPELSNAELGVQIGQPILAENIINAELKERIFCCMRY